MLRTERKAGQQHEMNRDVITSASGRRFAGPGKRIYEFVVE